MNRLMKGIGIFIAGVVALVAVAAIALWVWAGTQASLDWTLDRIAQSQSVKAEGVEGSLRTGLKAKHIAWESAGLKVEAFDADLAWQPFALAHGTVKLDYLRAGRLRIEDTRPPKPKEIPANLALPVRVEVDDVRVAQLQWVTPEREVEVMDIAASYSFSAIRHHAKVTNVRWMQSVFSGEGSLDAVGTLALDAKLRGQVAAAVPGAKTVAPLVLDASLHGKLADIQLKAQLQGAAGSPEEGTKLAATARVAAFDEVPVPQVDASFERLDTGALWPQAPRTSLTGKATVKPHGTGTWAISIDAANAAVGAWDMNKLPVEQLTATAEWRSAGEAVVHELNARVGGGALDASGRWRTSGAWAFDAKLANIDPGALHGQLAHVPVSGTAQVSGEARGIAFALNLAASGKAADRDVAALELRSAKASGRWNGETLSLPTLDVRTSDAAIVAAIEVQPKAKTGSGRISLDAPGLQVRGDGKVAQRTGGGKVDVHASDAAQALQWLARWPGVPRDAATRLAAGRADAQLAWQGGWDAPAVQLRVTAPELKLKGDAAPTLRDVTLAASANRKGAQWQGRFAQVNAAVVDPALGAGAWTLALQRPFDWRWSAGRFETGAGEARLQSPRAKDAPAQLAWDPVRWGGGELHTSGRLNGLPLAWIELFGGPQLSGSAVTGDMVFDAQWDAQLGATPRIRASLARSRGDITVLAEDAQGHAVRVPAGVREARIAIDSTGEQVTGTLRWDSEHGGSADGRVATRLVRGGAAGWQWPDTAPLKGELRAKLPRIGVWSLLAPPGWRLRGSLVANVAIGGTKGDAQLAGTLSADDLALRSVVDGVEMQGGRLRVRLDGRRVVIDEFTLHGSGPEGGTLSAKGEGTLAPTGPQASITAEITKLRASIRSDRQVTVSGNVTAKRDASGTLVEGKLHIDRANIVLPDQSTPKLSDDVVVHNEAAPITKREAKAMEDASKKPSDKLQVALDVDLGDDFHVQGIGVDTHLRGTLALTGASVAQARIVGTIHARGGEYRAYGQRLDIERGIIRFTGAPENPALDVLAIRPNIAQRAGVQVTGTALAPFVRLYSDPALPDAETLAWLVTGRAAPATGAESALVQQAALALLASRSGNGKQGIAASLGLDEVSFQREGTQGPSVTVGKRFARNFYAAYERSLSGAIGTLSIFYDITRKLTLRGQAGERTAVDLIYTFSFD